MQLARNPTGLSPFPQADVTFNLALPPKRADSDQGGGGVCGSREKDRNSFVVKILTSKPLALKILQTLFANPAPVRRSSRGGGGGIPHKRQVSPNDLAES